MKENFPSDGRQLVNTFNTFNTFFSDIDENLKVQREENCHEIISNNPDPILNSIERHPNHPCILGKKDMMQQKYKISTKFTTSEINLIKDSISLF